MLLSLCDVPRLFLGLMNIKIFAFSTILRVFVGYLGSDRILLASRVLRVQNRVQHV